MVSQAIPATSLPPREASPTMNDKEKAVLVDLDCKHSASHYDIDPPLVAPCPPAVASSFRPPFIAHGLVPVVATSPSPLSPVVVGLPIASPTSPLQATEVLSSPLMLSILTITLLRILWNKMGLMTFSLTLMIYMTLSFHLIWPRKET